MGLCSISRSALEVGRKKDLADMARKVAIDRKQAEKAEREAVEYEKSSKAGYNWRGLHWHSVYVSTGWAIQYLVG